MDQKAIGILHPGKMGVSVAASAKAGGHDVCWVSESRSGETRERAENSGLRDVGTLADLCETCSILISICPPHAAKDVAAAVLERGFRGIYVDANAISPETSTHIANQVNGAGATFVDGGIVGGPAWKPGTWLYLSGPDAATRTVASCFAIGPLGVEIVGQQPGKASALKMCYAAYTKGTSALLAAILATAESYGIRENLETQWSHEDPEFPGRIQLRTRRVTAKAWRFVGEMTEIAATFQAAGLPEGFHEASAEVYRRMVELGVDPDPTELPPLDAVLKVLRKG